jgi:hypothetical protein
MENVNARHNINGLCCMCGVDSATCSHYIQNNNEPNVSLCNLDIS